MYGFTSTLADARLREALAESIDALKVDGFAVLVHIDVQKRDARALAGAFRRRVRSRW